MFDEEPKDGGGFTGDDQPESSLDRATAYLEEHPLHGDAPEKPGTEDKKVDAAKPADGKPEADKVADGAKPAEGAKPEDKAAAPALEEKAILEHPKYKELQTQFEGNKAVLDELRPILTGGAYPIQNAEQLKGVLSDSFMLYDIASGKQKVGVLLDAMEKNAGWTEAQKQAIYLDLRDALHAKGVDMKAPELDPRNPEHRAILDLRARVESGDKQKAESAIEDTRQKTVGKLIETVNSLAEKAGVSKEDAIDYAIVLSAKIGASPDILKQVEAGKFSEVERLFTEHNNREIARQKRWLDAKVSSKEAREKDLPRTPTRDGGPAPKPGDKPYRNREQLQTAEGRLKAVDEEWKKSGTA